MTKRVLLNLTLLLWFIVPALAQPAILIDDKQVLSGEIFTLDVKAKDFPTLLGMQFTLTWNPSVILLDSLILGEASDLPAYELQSFNINNANGGFIATSWTDEALVGVELPDTAVLFSIQFKSVGTIGETTSVEITDSPVIQEYFGVDSSDIVFFTPELQNGNVSIGMSTSLTELEQTKELPFMLAPNEPNPFKRHTVIPFETYQTLDLSLEIHDTNGKLVYTERSNYPPGKHNIILDAEKLPAAGIYYYTLKTKDNFITNRMVLVR